MSGQTHSGPHHHPSMEPQTMFQPTLVPFQAWHGNPHMQQAEQVWIASPDAQRCAGELRGQDQEHLHNLQMWGTPYCSMHEEGNFDQSFGGGCYYFAPVG